MLAGEAFYLSQRYCGLYLDNLTWITFIERNMW